MTENSRIDELRRRVQKDPASIAFAQLAEECRRAGAHQEAADICRSGLAIHPGYLSARVTLGRALIELGQLEEAQAELARVLENAPDNLAAIRGLAEIHHRRGELDQALAQYRAALLLARNDPDLEETIADLSHQVEPAKPAAAGGLTLEHMQHELLKHTPQKATAAQVAPPPQADLEVVRADNPAEAGRREDTRSEAESREDTRADPGPDEDSPRSLTVAAFAAAAPPVSGTLEPSPNDRATQTVAALEEWLAAIHVARSSKST
jgi:tetratricopeptide (TPR) repeat protein